MNVAAALPALPALDPRWWPESTCGAEAQRNALRALDEALGEALFAGAPVVELVRIRAAALDRLCVSIWRECGLQACNAALVATGGYGRGEVFPHSDLDLQLLVAAPPDSALTASIERFFAALWDIGLKIGHAVRTVAECVAAALDDLTVITTLSEVRLLAGAGTLVDEFQVALAAPRVWPPDTYARAKRAEQAARHARYNDTAYNLEPNLKEGPGGARDLQVPIWIARRSWGIADFAGLLRAGWLSPEEHAALIEARALLWRYRFGLHVVAGRAEERLLFEHQRSLAERFGHRDERSDNLAIEQFMQAYFRAAHGIARMNERLLQRFEEAQVADPVHEDIDVDFVAVGGFLDARDPQLFGREPAAMVRVFRVLLERPDLRGLRSTLLSHLDRALAETGGVLARDVAAAAAFLAVCRHAGAVAEAIERMARLGVLAALIPAFGRVSGRMQYDLFHVYTVDQHTLTVLRNIRRYADPQSAQELPLAHELYLRLRKPEIVLLAGLFHDIAKGRGGDHSELGEVDAREFGLRLRLSSADVERICWLVRHHLLMSVTAQKQDIGDPQVVHRFATLIADSERLDDLYLLTVADIRGTSPKLWNSWKDRLLSDLHAATRYALRRGLEHPVHASERVAETKALALADLEADGKSARDVYALWAEFPEDSFLRYTPEQIAWQSAAILDADPANLPLVLVREAGERGASEVFVYSFDRDGLFATITAVLDRFGLNVLDARIATSRNDMSLDTFLVLEADGRPLRDPLRLSDLVVRLRSELSKAELALTPARRSWSRQQKHFRVPTRTEFSIAAQRTQLALICSDRPGILAHVAQAFRACALKVHDARIATFGERVEDFFVLTDLDNRPLSIETEQALAAQIRHEIDGGPTRKKPNVHA